MFGATFEAETYLRSSVDHKNVLGGRICLEQHLKQRHTLGRVSTTKCTWRTWRKDLFGATFEAETYLRSSVNHKHVLGGRICLEQHLKQTYLRSSVDHKHVLRGLGGRVCLEPHLK